MSTSLTPFDPSAALKAVDDADDAELKALDKEVTELGGRVIALVRDVHARATADNDKPVRTQIDSARRARDELRAMLNATTGGSSSGTTLTDDQRKLIALLDAGDIRLIKVDDPDNPGTKVDSVRDTRDRLLQGRNRGSAPTPSTSQPPAATPTPTPNPASPATPPTPAGTSGQGTTTPPANPTTPAPVTAGLPPVAAPVAPPAQPSASTTPPQQPAPAAPGNGSTLANMNASGNTTGGAAGQGQTTPQPAPAPQSPVGKALNWIRNH